MNSGTTVVFVGDDLIAGRGDPRGQGWAGRVVARTEPPASVIPYFLAVPGENTNELASRWEHEAALRFDLDGKNRLVIGLGWSDLDAEISVARARLNLANIVTRAAALHIPTMIVGPPPRRPEDEAKIAAYDRAFAEVADRRDIPYVEILGPLKNHEQWLSDMRASNYTWPAQYGYGLMAWLVLHSHFDEWIK